MARTLAQIEAEIIAAKNADANLAGLTSVSNTALYLLEIKLIAYALYTQDRLWEEFQKEVEARILQNTWGGLEWYVNIAKKFQYGDAVEQLPNNEPYAVIDTEKRIVTFASVTESGNVLNLKVAKGTAEAPEALDSSEKVAFAAYIGKLKGAGTLVNIVSLPADLLRITATVEYDGQYTLADIQARVQSAIENFLFAIPFNGKFYKNKMADAIDNEAGVVNFDLDTAVIRAIQGASNVLIATSYQTIAGYLRLDIPNFNITYTPA